MSVRPGLYLKTRFKDFAWRFTPAPEPEKWVFIVGCYNSGTTLLHRLLARHPLIGSMPNEGQFYSDVLPRGRDLGLPRLWAIKPEAFHLKETSGTYDVDKLMRQWAWMYNDIRKPVLIEKTILHAARTRWLQQHFPNSYFIALFRHGYAVAEGIRRKENHSIEQCITQWTVSNLMLLDDLQYIKNKISITYESLTADPAAIMKQLTDFIGIAPLGTEVFTDEFEIHKSKSGIENKNADSVSRLSPSEIAVMNTIGGEAFQKLGYQIS
jgi:hypothetical protein